MLIDPDIFSNSASIVDLFSPEHEIAERKYKEADAKYRDLIERRDKATTVGELEDLNKQISAQREGVDRLRKDYWDKTEAYQKSREASLDRRIAADRALDREMYKERNKVYEAGLKAGKGVGMKIPLAIGALGILGAGAYGLHKGMSAAKQHN